MTLLEMGRSGRDNPSGSIVHTSSDNQLDPQEPTDNEPPQETTAPVSPFVLYMSPLGSDSRSGLSPDAALLTLSGVQSKLKLYKPVVDQDVEIRIRFMAARPYLRQTVDWTHTSKTHTITFLPEDYNYRGGVGAIAGRPVFDGQGTQDWFFDLRVGGGQASNVRFYYVRVQGYVPGAIRFLGSRNDRNGFNGLNTVYGCYFFELGNKKYPTTSFGFGALDLVNSDHNFIRNNHFIKIENKSGGDASHIHGIYLAHSSDRNLIIANRFSYITGDPIRVRDFSNNNDILENAFIRTGKYAFYSDFHASGECRSWQNEFRNNSPLSCSYSGDYLTRFRYFDNDPRYPEGANCLRLPKRLSTSGNDPLSCP